MKCLNCGNEMNLYKVYNLSNNNYQYTVENHECPFCKIKVQFSNNIFKYGIIKTEVPFNLKPTLNQISAMDTIATYLPFTKDVRNLCITKRLASIFISTYKNNSYEVRNEYIENLENNIKNFDDDFIEEE